MQERVAVPLSLLVQPPRRCSAACPGENRPVENVSRAVILNFHKMKCCKMNVWPIKYSVPNETGLGGIPRWSTLPGKRDEKGRNILEPLYAFLQKQRRRFWHAEGGEGLMDKDGELRTALRVQIPTLLVLPGPVT